MRGTARFVLNDRHSPATEGLRTDEQSPSPSSMEEMNVGEGVEEKLGGGGAQDFLFRMRNSSHSSPPHFLYREMVLGETRVRTPNKDGHRSGLQIRMVMGQDSK